MEFDNPNFSAVSWINSYLSSYPGLLDPTATGSPRILDSPLASISEFSKDDDKISNGSSDLDKQIESADILSNCQSDLHVIARDAHAELDAAIARALNAVPWAVRESEKVRQRANVLRANVDGVCERVAGVEGSVSAAVTAIANADTIIRRVEASADLLSQVAHVDTLLARLDSLLTSSASDGSELVLAADVVAELRASLENLRFIPDIADRFEQLETADTKLEMLAAPRLREALETENAAAATNARIVFDRAGRDNAFVAQYVSIRGSHISKMWETVWSHQATPKSEMREDLDDPQVVNDVKLEPAVAESRTARPIVSKTPVHVSDLSSTEAAIRLDSFYEKLLAFLHVEAKWLTRAFPDLTPRLLPSLLSSCLSQLRSPLISELQPNSSLVSSSGVVRLHHNALRAIRAAGDIGKLLASNVHPEGAANLRHFSLPEHVAFNTTPGNDIHVLVHDAILSVLFPNNVFWDSWLALAARVGEVRVQELPLEISQSGHEGNSTATMSSKTSLEAIAKRVEGISKSCIAIFEKLFEQTMNWTVGVGVIAIPHASSAVSAALTKRLKALIDRNQSLRCDSTGDADDWASVAGALRLLRAVSGLKQAWEFRKEAGVSAAAQSAVKMVDTAIFVQHNPVQYVDVLVNFAQNGSLAEASAFCELMRDDSLATRVMATIGSSGNRSDDLSSLLDCVHRVVYDCIFRGIERRFDAFHRETLLGDDENDGPLDPGIVGFSSSPLSYATEVADYLMTIPQQLEPFVPDENVDEGYATPASIHAFSPHRALEKYTAMESSKRHVRKYSDTSELADAKGLEAELDEAVLDPIDSDGVVLSFAGMWIGAIAVGTMELYVEKICAVKTLRMACARQLAIDVDYICNVLATLGVTASTELNLVRELLESAPNETAFAKIFSEHEQFDHRVLVRRIASLRGVKVSI